jgi:hypothetical protein
MSVKKLCWVPVAHTSYRGGRRVQGQPELQIDTVSKKKKKKKKRGWWELEVWLKQYSA